MDQNKKDENMPPLECEPVDPQSSYRQVYDKKSNDQDNEDNDFPPLECEPDKFYRSISEILDGRRIVNLGHVLKEYEKILNHKYKCTMGRMDFVKEHRKGIISYLHFYCDSCEKRYVITTDRPGKSLDDVNKAVVWGSLSVGIGHSQCEELFGVLEVPFLNSKKFISETRHVKKVSLESSLIAGSVCEYFFQILKLREVFSSM